MGLIEHRNGKVPVWFMRQAGRYHSHYQEMKKKHTFIDLCKKPELACETAMGPVNEFDFDAAILFSDLLFPLDHLGMGLSYESGPPTLAFRLESSSDVKNLKEIAPAREYYQFQKDALILTREALHKEKSLIGFVGGPFTLFTYAVEGTHRGNLLSAHMGLVDSRFDLFLEKLEKSLFTEMELQAEGGAEILAIMDTAIGELSPLQFKMHILPTLQRLIHSFKYKYPNVKVLYYTKGTTEAHLEQFRALQIDILGIDWRFDLGKVLERFSDQFMIQGNLPPQDLFLPWKEVERRLIGLYKRVDAKYRPKWIMGLGHGVLQHTPQDNVERAVAHIQNHYRE